MLHVIGAIKKTCEQSRVIVGIGSTYMGLTLHMNKILTYLIINMMTQTAKMNLVKGLGSQQL